jgi:hypothetical protein
MLLSLENRAGETIPLVSSGYTAVWKSVVVGPVDEFRVVARDGSDKFWMSIGMIQRIGPLSYVAREGLEKALFFVYIGLLFFLASSTSLFRHMLLKAQSEDL